MDVNPNPEMTPRRQAVLGLIIRSYIERRMPVGSKMFVQSYGLDISPATIRNEMAALEEMGYLTHPHTSAGRIPTEAGYRYFVEHLLGETDLPLPEQHMIRHQFHQARLELDQWVRLAVAVLAHTTRKAALATPPRSHESRLQAPGTHQPAGYRRPGGARPAGRHGQAANAHAGRRRSSRRRSAGCRTRSTTGSSGKRAGEIEREARRLPESGRHIGRFSPGSSARLMAAVDRQGRGRAVPGWAAAHPGRARVCAGRAGAGHRPGHRGAIADQHRHHRRPAPDRRGAGADRRRRTLARVRRPGAGALALRRGGRRERAAGRGRPAANDLRPHHRRGALCRELDERPGRRLVRCG